MKVLKQINKASGRLLLVFTGWSASPDLFERMRGDDDQDIWICYDYRDLVFGEDLSTYQTIDLLGWSFGVWVATTLIPVIPLSKIRTAIAINGTPYPIHDTWGIPEAIFRGTLNNLTEEGIHRFNRRMCGNREILRQYETIPPRPLEEIKEELQNLYTASILPIIPELDTHFWTQAILSSADRIFPTKNLHHYWERRCPVKQIEAPHYPFYKWTKWNEIWNE